ncbi:MAG TPA: PH domain-containing protein [Candidatus Didemnitutus sp.]|nr:PH domain-containing protein [Candidatus Didemnitutus sp.]
MSTALTDEDIHRLERPSRALFDYYLLGALIVPPLFPIVILPLYFRYHTMRYRFTTEGISMSWGILFRRQIIVNYARIQDIHLRSNIVERWLGLGRILIQTASGSGAAEMTIEGIKEYEALRDFLYVRMRGVHDHSAVAAAPSSASGATGSSAEVAAALREATQELRALREVLAERHNDPGDSSSHV